MITSIYSWSTSDVWLTELRGNWGSKTIKSYFVFPQARPDLSAILSFEGCGNILASVSVPDTETLPYDNYFFIIDKEVLVLFKVNFC